MKRLILPLLFITLINSCGIYSFSGATVGKAETISIDVFDNKASIVVPSLSQTFTESLRDKFLTESPLALVPRNGDWQMSGYISKYKTTFLAVKQDQPARNRLIMGVKLKFVNTLDPEKDFERNFEQFTDFDANQELSAVEDQLIEELTERLLVDIFNATVNNW